MIFEHSNHIASIAIYQTALRSRTIYIYIYTDTNSSTYLWSYNCTVKSWCFFFCSLSLSLSLLIVRFSLVFRCAQQLVAPIPFALMGGTFDRHRSVKQSKLYLYLYIHITAWCVPVASQFPILKNGIIRIRANVCVFEVIYIYYYEFLLYWCP